MPPTKPLAERFWSKVIVRDGCWGWNGSTTSHGYARLGIGAPSRYIEVGHRVSWMLHYGPIPDGKHVLHRCDNPPCTNPEHLFLGDPAANSHDAWQKGRASPPPRHEGEAHPNAKLTATFVRTLRELRYTDAISLGERLGISRSTVEAVRSRRLWKHVA